MVGNSQQSLGQNFLFPFKWWLNYNLITLRASVLKIGPGEQILILYSSSSIVPTSCAILIKPKKCSELKIGFLIALSMLFASLTIA